MAPARTLGPMGKTFDAITESMRDFVAKQHMFLVATAPTDGGRVNVSPKGLETFLIDSPHRVAYLDLTGSGAETIAHLRQNGRITIMFCAFEGLPNIVRFYGNGRAVFPGSDEFNELAARFPARRGTRSIIVVDVDRTSTSCGYGVPRMEFTGDRPTLGDWADARSDDEIAAYWAQKNKTSIDGLPAVD